MRRILIAVVVLGLAAAARAQEKPQDHLLTAQSFHRDITVSLDCPYLLFLPRDFAARPDDRWPLLLFLHGAGERGTNVWRADLHGPAKYIAQHPDFPFVVVSPICPSNQVWSVDILTRLLDEAIDKYRIDTNRVYLTGLSMGGFGAWDLAMACPQRFAAVIPIAGGGNDGATVLARAGYTTKEYVAALRSLPFWAFHGARDTVVDPDESERMIAALKRTGVKEAKITIYPDATHNSWERTYNNPEIYAWLLAHQR